MNRRNFMSFLAGVPILSALVSKAAKREKFKWDLRAEPTIRELVREANISQRDIMELMGEAVQVTANASWPVNSRRPHWRDVIIKQT